jgi:peptide/nickel transport system permease protein
VSYLLRRAGVFLAGLAVASVLVFTVMAVLPGDPAQVAAGTDATPEQIEALREEYGLNGGPVERYFSWIGGILTGDLGTTFVGKRPITDEIGIRMQVTIPLTAMAMALSIAVAVPLGMAAALHHRRPLGTAVTAFSQIGIAVPAFWAGLMLSTVVGVNLGWLPANGFTPWDDSVSEAFLSLVLPAVSLALVQGAVLTRYVRSAVLEVLRDDHLRTARAKGMTRVGALRRHGLRNAAVPIVTVIGLQVSALLVGAVVIENVFALPGLGKLLVDAVSNREVVLVQDIVMLLTLVVLLIGLLVDVLYVLIDPRLRHGLVVGNP